MSATGLLLVLEGGEGVGKTTQWARLTEVLQGRGHDVLALREPGGTAPGDAIRSLLLDAEGSLAPATEALLFAASRAELIARAVRPALEAGRIVVLDRYLLSTYVYQGAGRGLELADLRAVNRLATGGIVPHCTLLLQLPLEEAMQRITVRGAPDRLEREARSFHERVARGFERAAQSEWQREHPECGPIVAISATGTPNIVAHRCMEVLDERWPALAGSPPVAPS